MTGPEISASQWLSCVQAILHCWRPACTASDVETLPLVHIAMVLTWRQNIWCYTAQHTTRRGGSHGQICTIIATQDAYGASWGGSGRWPVPLTGNEREREQWLHMCVTMEILLSKYSVRCNFAQFLSTKATDVCRANNGPGPVSPWSLYIGPLWPNKYWNSYNHNSVVPQKQLNLFNKYLLLVTFETNDNYSVRFKISNNSSSIRFNSKWKKNTIRTALINHDDLYLQVNQYVMKLTAVDGDYAAEREIRFFIVYGLSSYCNIF